MDRRSFTHTLLGGVAASVAATLVTPYGIALWRFIATAVPPRPDIAEWTPIQLLTPPGEVYVGFVLLGVAGLIRERPVDERRQIGRTQGLQHIDARARQQRIVDFKRRILRGRADQDDDALLHVSE